MIASLSVPAALQGKVEKCQMNSAPWMGITGCQESWAVAALKNFLAVVLNVWSSRAGGVSQGS